MSFRKCLKQRRAWYKSLDSIDVSVLSEEVIFNSKGFYHLKWDGQGKRRSVKEFHYKLWLLPLIIPVIKQVKNVYEYKPPRYSKRLGKYFEIWELRDEVSDEKITEGETFEVSVILRRVGSGKIHFYSIWGKSKKRS